MKKAILIGFVVFAFFTTNAQISIKGKIIDQDGVPLPGTSVYIPEMNKGTVSDREGRYQLTNLPNGEVGIRFSYIGYASQFIKVIPSQRKGDLDVTLIPSAIESEEIVISGGYHSTQHENAVKIDILRMDPMEIRSTPNFTEVLTKVPGVDMISKGPGVAKPVIRGLSMNDILILNNGVRYENYQYSSHHPLGIGEFGVGSVEVIKGPASLLYGSDAIGGVIDFIKEKPATMGTVSGDYNLQLFSNTLGMTNNLGVKGANRHFFGGVRAGNKTNADFLQGGGEYVPNSRFNETSFQANAGYTGKVGTFKLYYDYLHQKLGLVEEEAVEEITERGRKNEIFYQQFNTHMISSLNKFYLGKYKLEVNPAYQSTELVHFGAADEYELQMRLGTLTYEAKLHLPSDEKSEYLVGFQGFNQQNINLNNRETILLPDAMTSNYSGFGFAKRSFFKKLEAQAGIRYDYRTITTEAVSSPSEEGYRAPLDKSYGSFSGSVGATWSFTEKLLLRANVAAGFRSPNLAELTSNGQHELRYEIGNDSLNPENSLEGDVNIHYHVDNVTFDVAGFYNSIQNYIFIAPTGDNTGQGISIYRYMQSNSTLYGGEAGFHFHPRFAKWLHFETTLAYVIGTQENGDYLPFIPATKLNVEFRAELEKLGFLHNAFASVGTQTAFNQYHPAPEESKTNGYTLLNVSIGGKIKIQNQFLIIGISANNLLDTKYIDHLSTLKEVNLYDPGRNIALTLKVPFGLVGGGGD
jgi:iron complex outermembrane receptor protein